MFKLFNQFAKDITNILKTQRIYIPLKTNTFIISVSQTISKGQIECKVRLGRISITSKWYKHPKKLFYENLDRFE